MKDIKQVIVMRTGDLTMRKGKMIAQGAHASMAWLCNRLSTGPDGVTAFHGNLTEVEKIWVEGAFKKICVQVKTDEELLDIYEQAKKARLNVELITDSGLTEFHGVPTNTCLAIGPDYAENIDPITGGLKLL